MTQPIKACFQLDFGGFQLDVDLELPGSGITVLFGCSGSGKTTLLRCVAGLQTADHARLEINGRVWEDSRRKIFLPTYRRALGYVFQEANLFPHLSVADNLQYGLRRLDKSAGKADLPYILDILGISHLLDRMPERLSGGERQRVAIARALALNPEILLMDEPLASLDFKRKQEILPFIGRLHRELSIPVLYVTHSRQEVAQLADHLLILAAGKVQACGGLAETLCRLDLDQAQDWDAATVWQAQVIGHDEAYCLTRVGFDGGVLDLPQVEAPSGASLRVQIHARDVSIVLQAPQATSILNILPATVVALGQLAHGQSVVRLRVGGQPLLAHITRKSAELLGLRAEMQVFVQIKGISLLN